MLILVNIKNIKLFKSVRKIYFGNKKYNKENKK